MAKEFRGNSADRVHYKPLSKAQKARNHAAAQEANIRTCVLEPKGSWGRSHTEQKLIDGKLHVLHVTKGWKKAA